MKSGGQAALLIAGLGLAGCVAGTKAVEVRAISDPLAALQGSDDLAIARGQLRLGNVGLALEAFRKVQRDRPSDPAALAGIGDCYSAMGRLDLAQSNYEAALALAPKSPALLNGLALVLERKGQGARAVAVRVEAAVAAIPVVLASAELPSAVQPAAQVSRSSVKATPLPTGSVTVSLPPARPAEHLQGNLAELEAGVPAANGAPLSSSVTVILPAAVPARAARRSAVTVPTAARLTGPRLERLSPGEVALVTSGQSLWGRQLVARTASSTPVRWVPLPASGSRPNVQVLNAARAEGLAASARAVLIDRGWRRIAIGDAARTQQKSVVLYPKERAGLARSLAAQFGIGTRLVEGDQLILVLGRDKAEAIKGQRG
jgi:hypothetical protein